ncbi:hypothetical protein ACFL6X_07220 [Candidatus Latescibacterota bacterium]
METTATIAALVMMAAVILAKVLAIRLQGHAEHRIANVQSIKKELLRELTMVGQQQKVLQANKTTLERKKTKLEGKRSRLNQELQSIKDEADQRERVKETRRGQLTRVARVG